MVNYKRLAEELMDLLEYETSTEWLLYDLISLGYDIDKLTELGFSSEDIERVSVMEMNNESPTK